MPLNEAYGWGVLPRNRTYARNKFIFESFDCPVNTGVIKISGKVTLEEIYDTLIFLPVLAISHQGSRKYDLGGIGSIALLRLDIIILDSILGECIINLAAGFLVGALRGINKLEFDILLAVNLEFIKQFVGSLLQPPESGWQVVITQIDFYVNYILKFFQIGFGTL